MTVTSEQLDQALARWLAHNNGPEDDKLMNEYLNLKLEWGFDILAARAARKAKEDPDGHEQR